MVRVNEGSHSFTCHPRVYPQVEWAVPFRPTPKPQSITALWLVLISRPAEGMRLSWPGWFGEIVRWFSRPKTVNHPNTRCGGRESNSRPSTRKFNALTTRLPSHLYTAGQTHSLPAFVTGSQCRVGEQFTGSSIEVLKLNQLSAAPVWSVAYHQCILCVADPHSVHAPASEHLWDAEVDRRWRVHHRLV